MTELTSVISACPGHGTVESCSIIDAMKGRDEGMKCETLQIEGMQCAGCAERLQKILVHERGGRSVDISFHDRAIALNYPPQVRSLNPLFKNREKIRFSEIECE